MKVYENSKDFNSFRAKFPEMFEYSERVKVIGWRDEFGVIDYNHEIIDEIEFWHRLYKSGSISYEEYKKKIDNLPPYASKTLGIAFLKTNEVSFREEKPSFRVVLHELGHCYFKKPDPVWNAVYLGGEYLMWLIIQNKYEGKEEDIRKYMQLLEELYCDSEKVMGKIEKIAQELYQKYFDKELVEEVLLCEEAFQYENTVKLCLCTGHIPNSEYFALDVLSHALHSIEYQDFALIWTEFLKKLLSEC